MQSRHECNFFSNVSISMGSVMSVNNALLTLSTELHRIVLSLQHGVCFFDDVVFCGVFLSFVNGIDPLLLFT